MNDREDRRRDAPRVRDLPAPRESPSVIGPLFGWLFQWPYRVVLAGLYRAGFRAWQLTMLSLVANVAVGVLLLTGRRLLPGILLLPAGLLDLFDGGVARLRGEDSRKGALLDSVSDRASDAFVFACLFYAEMAIHREPTVAAFTLAAMVLALLVSYFRAEGEAVGLNMAEGKFQRLERYVALSLGLIAPGMLLPVLAVLTGMGLWTIAERVRRAWSALPPAAIRLFPVRRR